MRTPVCSIMLVALTLEAPAATTITALHRYAWGANLGWIDWRSDVTNGAVIGEYFCAGFLHIANAGWINLGDGSPANGISYQNNSASEFGVNHDGFGDLSGCAWSANLGWLTFTNRDIGGLNYAGPRIDLLTGQLSGFVWSANAGWISLSNAQAIVQTDRIASGEDSDGDGIPDAWERLRFGNLTANSSSDGDGDGVTDWQDYLADIDPLDPVSSLRITSLISSLSSGTVSLTWTSESTRLYRIRRTNDLGEVNAWTDSGLGLLPPDAGGFTTRSLAEPVSSRRFFRIEAVKPLSP